MLTLTLKSLFSKTPKNQEGNVRGLANVLKWGKKNKFVCKLFKTRVKVYRWTSGCSPYKIRAVAAERWLLEKTCDKFVVLNFVHVLLSQRAFAGESVPDPGRVIVM